MVLSGSGMVQRCLGLLCRRGSVHTVREFVLPERGPPTRCFDGDQHSRSVWHVPPAVNLFPYIYSLILITTQFD